MNRHTRAITAGGPSVARTMLAVAALGCLLAATTLAPAQGARADARADAQSLVDDAATSFANLRADPNMTWFREHVRNAKGVLIVPQLLKAGFIFGGSGGGGVLLGRGADGVWSHPAFYNMGSVTFGLQIGGEVAEVVLMIMTDRGMDAMYTTEFKLGADVSVAAGPVGAGAQAATADVLAFSRSKGVFGGLTVEGAIIGADGDRNAAYYGRSLRPIEIVAQRKVSNPGASRLRATVAGGAGGGPAPSATAPAAYDLETIQRALKTKGFDPGPVDGKLGPGTRRAIREYEAAMGMPVTGAPTVELQRRLVAN